MKLFGVIMLLCSAAGSIFGQAQSASGDIQGRLKDPSGGTIAGATITVFDPDRGIQRSTLTDEDGQFKVPLLAPGAYHLRCEAQGFATQVLSGLEVRVGDSVPVEIRMEVGPMATEINVQADVAVVDPERYQQANTIDQARIQRLPINRRNYLDFVLLAPAAADTTDMVDGTDFRVAQTPQSGISFGGGNGRGNIFLIDGVENYYVSGGVRSSISQEAVQEFQINRGSFSTELGGGFGGAVNIVTRSGTNQLHGNLFGFLRHRAIQARNFFDPGKSSYTRSQAGATLGGPLSADRTFFFAAFERLDRQETAFVPILQDRSAFGGLTPSQEELISTLEAGPSAQLRGLAAQMRRALTPSNNPLATALFNRNSGIFPFSEDSSQFSLRLDHRFTNNHSAFFRGNFTKNFQQNSQFGALVAFNRGRSVDVWDGTLVASDTCILSPRWIVGTRAMFNYNYLDVIPTDANGPEINITGFGFFGRDIFLPSRTDDRHYQALQNWSYNSGDKDWKLGWDLNPTRTLVRSETFFSGRFGFGEAVPLGAVLVAATGDPAFPAQLAQSLAALGQARLVPNISAPISALQAFSLGLPTFYQQGFGDPVWIGWTKRFNFYAQHGRRLFPGFRLNLGARYELETNEKVVGTDPNNIAPRIGFAWTPGASGKTVLRGGYGLYYSMTNLQIPNVAETLSGEHIRQVLVPLTGLPVVINPLTRSPLTSADVYQRLLGQGIIGNRPILESDLSQFGLRVSPNLPGRVVFGADPDYANPYSQQASLEIERAFGEFAVSIAYNFNRTAHIARILGRNLFYTGALPDGRPTFGRIDPAILQRNIFSWSANAFYHAGILQVSRRLSRGIAFNAHYTWSKAIDEATDFNSDFSPHDQLNAAAERALSAFHHAHRFVLNAVLESPLKGGRGKGALANLLAGWSIAPIAQANSFRPFNILTGVDILNDGYTTNKRPHKAGRNLGRGPDFFSIDLRLARKFPFAKDGRRNVEFIAEGFNLLNRTNFRTVNNTVGNVRLEDLPNPIVGRPGAPTAPLSFTSAFDPRQFQFGLKIHF